MTGFVWIHNPETDGVAYQPAAAVAELWAKKGFTRIDVDLSVVSATLGVPVADLSQVPESYVRSLAARNPAPDPIGPREEAPAESKPAAATRRRAAKEEA